VQFSSHMRVALSEACAAYRIGAVPVGAVIVRSGVIVAKAHNEMATDFLDLPQPVSHAEIIAMVIACRVLKQTHLQGCEIYSTLEPCPMCFAAISHMRIKKIFFGAYDLRDSKMVQLPGKGGAHFDNVDNEVEIFGGFSEEKCSRLLTAYFKKKREFSRNPCS
jgi:tRNA(Arg) A34 adenosine deaminase TadA